ncbi:MAG: phosphomannomutase CpsG [Gammaproteobacteria bacterium]|nr:phosphomannomutase CpsG [Gammaproteobacteria bacterium]
MTVTIDSFKAYDIRGQIPNQINADICYRIGNATAAFLEAKTLVVGRDMRLTSNEFADAVISGLTDAGVEVFDIGLCGTEMVYFATNHLRADGGIMVTASHNPADYNGLKLVREEARPISADTGLAEIRALAESDDRVAAGGGSCTDIDLLDAYIGHMLSYVDVAKLKSLRLVMNPGNGCGGIASDALEPFLPFDMIKVHNKPDGTFPNGIPNPMLEHNQAVTSQAVRENKADMGIAWDGDFDRCFLFDENGTFIEGYYIVGLLAESIIVRNPGAKIVHDPRMTWNTLDIVAAAGGEAVLSKSGHSFIKETMRDVDGAYGGEMSAHHYFRDFWYADSGMIPWLLVAELISVSGKTLSELVGTRMSMYPASGEINRKVSDAAATLQKMHDTYAADALSVDETDGYSFEFEEWRFNIRQSNTEPVVRLNVESRGNIALLRTMTEQLTSLIEST